MKLYHFTSLYSLAPITREGITRGSVPFGKELWQTKTALSLTTNTNPDALRYFASFGSRFNKLRVRLTVEIPERDERLENWRDFAKRVNMDKKWLRTMDPLGQGKFWYLFWGRIPADWITVIEVERNATFEQCQGGTLADLVRDIDREREKIEETPGQGGLLWLRLKSEDDSSWLMDEPVDQLGAQAARCPASGTGT
jgi:hypothetical protein